MGLIPYREKGIRLRIEWRAERELWAILRVKNERAEANCGSIVSLCNWNIERVTRIDKKGEDVLHILWVSIDLSYQNEKKDQLRNGK